MLKKLRHLILSASPQIEEKLVYNIPFFYGRKRIFYLNPVKNGIDLGFCNGYIMEKNPLLETKNRSQIRTAFFNNLSEITEEILLPLIHEAIIIDQNKLKRKV